MKNKNNDIAQLDLFTPIVEVVHKLGVEILKLLWELTKLIVRKITKAEPELKKIKRKELSNKKTTKKTDALGIDTKTKKEIMLNAINFSAHSFIVGASGFGKTNLISVLQEHSLQNNVPVIFFDPKGDLEALTTFKNLCESYNKTCYVFSEFHEDAITLNPVLEGSYNQVADRIMGAFEWSEQYYKDVCYRFLMKALKDLSCQGLEFSLKNIHEVLIEKYECKEITGLLVKIESILESDFGPFLNGTRDDLTFSKIKEEKACLYIGLSTQGYGETAMAIGKLFLGELLYNSYKILKSNPDTEYAKKNPIRVFFDEFGALVTFNFINLQNKCRGAGIELILAVQSSADIDQIDPTLTDQIIENSFNLFIMKQRLDHSAAKFANAIGTILTKKVTYLTENGEKSGMGSVREANELTVHPDIIKNLNIGQCILLRHSPVRVNMANIRKREAKKLNYIRPAQIKKIKAFV